MDNKNIRDVVCSSTGHNYVGNPYNDGIYCTQCADIQKLS